MNDTVISVNFGKKDREHARRFARLIGLVEAYEDDVLRDPIKHMEIAGKKIAELQMKIEEAKDAYRSELAVKMYEPLDDLDSLRPRTVTVMADEYKALRAMRAVLMSDESQ